MLTLASLNVFAQTNAEQPALPAGLESFSAEYAIKVAGISVGNLIRRFEIDTMHRYAFSSISESSGISALFQENSTTENTQGQIVNGIFSSEQYSRVRRKGKKTKSEKVEFDYGKGIAIKTRRGGTTQVPLAMPSFDPISYQLQIMFDLSSNKNELTYTIHSAKKEKLYKADAGPVETVQTPYSTMSAVKVVQQNNDGKKTTFWCAEALGFLPVKVKIEEDGRATTIVLKAYARLPGSDLQRRSPGV